MIAAYLFSLALGANPAVDPPTVLRPFTSLEQCLVEAEKRNRGLAGIGGDAGSVAAGTLHFCVRVVWPQ